MVTLPATQTSEHDSRKIDLSLHDKAIRREIIQVVDREPLESYYCSELKNVSRD
jgi:hypothetical protein